MDDSRGIEANDKRVVIKWPVRGPRWLIEALGGTVVEPEKK